MSDFCSLLLLTYAKNSSSENVLADNTARIATSMEASTVHPVVTPTAPTTDTVWMLTSPAFLAFRVVTGTAAMDPSSYLNNTSSGECRQLLGTLRCGHLLCRHCRTWISILPGLELRIPLKDSNRLSVRTSSDSISCRLSRVRVPNSSTEGVPKRTSSDLIDHSRMQSVVSAHKSDVVNDAGLWVDRRPVKNREILNR